MNDNIEAPQYPISEKKGIFGLSLNASALKYIAIVCMFIDHIAWAFVPFESLLGQLMHIIGRITAPVMCFMIAEGFHKTKNINKYTLRLFIFAMISWPAFSLFEAGYFLSSNLGVIYTFFLGLVALRLCKSECNVVVKISAVIGLCFLSFFGDWPIFGILYILSFGLNYQSFKKQVIWFTAVTVFMIGFMCLPALFSNGFNALLQLCNLGVFLALPLLYCYNGKRGFSKYPKLNKWIFYIFYPAHLVILFLFKLWFL